MKRILILMIGIIFLTSLATPVNAVTNLNIDFTTSDDNQLLNLRGLGEDFGWKFDYSPVEKTVYIFNQGQKVELQPGSLQFEGYNLPAAPVIIGDRTYIEPELAGILVRKLNQGEEEMPELLTELKVKPQKAHPGESITAYIKIVNISENEVALKYASGQIYDLYLFRDGQEVWRWSQGKYFTMALIKRDLGPGEKLDYTVEIPLNPDLEPGKYILTGEIATENPLKLNEIEIEIY